MIILDLDIHIFYSHRYPIDIHILIYSYSNIENPIENPNYHNQSPICPKQYLQRLTAARRERRCWAAGVPIAPWAAGDSNVEAPWRHGNRWERCGKLDFSQDIYYDIYIYI